MKNCIIIIICIWVISLSCTHPKVSITQQIYDSIIIDSVIDKNSIYSDSHTIQYLYYHTKKEPEYLDSIKVYKLKDKILIYVKYPKNKVESISYYPDGQISSVSYNEKQLRVNDVSYISYYQNGNIESKVFKKDSLIKKNERGDSLICENLYKYYYSNSTLKQMSCTGKAYGEKMYNYLIDLGTESNYDSLGRLAKTIYYYPGSEWYDRDYMIVTEYDTFGKKINEKIYRHCVIRETGCGYDDETEIRLKEIPK